jgi:hypothetical protein
MAARLVVVEMFGVPRIVVVAVAVVEFLGVLQWWRR